jgi:hypothetical protein
MKVKILKIFGKIYLMTFFIIVSCYKEDTIDCEIVAKVCGDAVNNVKECQYVFECKTK